MGPNTFVPLTWICKKQIAVSHSSSEAEIIALDDGYRLEGAPALQLWEEVIQVFNNLMEKKNGKASNTKVSAKKNRGKMQPAVPKMATDKLYDTPSGDFAGMEDVEYAMMVNALLNVDYVPKTVPRSTGLARLLVLEDNEAVIKMCYKGRSNNMRHVLRTQRVDLDALYEMLREDPGVFMKYVRTKLQMADMLTKASFTAIAWKELCELCC